MKTLLIIISRLALLLTIAPAILHVFGHLSIDAVKIAMIAGTLIWFISAPLLQRINELAEKNEIDVKPAESETAA